MKNLVLSLIIVTLAVFAGVAQTGKAKPPTTTTKTQAPAAKSMAKAQVRTNSSPAKTAAKVSPKVSAATRDGVVYQRTIKNRAAKHQVEKRFGQKAVKSYVGQTTQARLDKRQAEHAKKLGLKINDLKMEVIGKNSSRRTLRAVEQGFINKKGGIENLANKRNPVAKQKWEKHLQQIRTQNLRERRLRELKRRPV